MIDLNEKRFEDREIKIFNGGEAGVVKNCDVRVEKKSADDPDNGPDYKLYVTDESGGEVNEGLFRQDDFSNANNPKSAEEMYVKKMKHYAKVFHVQDQLPEKVNSYGELMDVTMKLCNKNQDNVKVNVAVAYGTVNRPSNYLRIDGIWGIQNAEDATPRITRKALTERPQPDDGPDVKVGSGSEDSSGVADDWA